MLKDWFVSDFEEVQLDLYGLRKQVVFNIFRVFFGLWWGHPGSQGVTDG